MGGNKPSKSNTVFPIGALEQSWPAWVRYAVSAALLFHLASLLAGGLAAAPSSELEREAVRPFAAYHQLIDQGYAYRYYAPEPGPTPIAIARIAYGDGRPEETLRLPQRGLKPRLRYQRQLALANHLAVDYEAARTMTGDGSRSRWARSYARHLARSHPGCAHITLLVQSHLIPDPEQVRHALEAPGRPRVDLDAEEFYTVPERIGEYSCDAW